jgi:hypothetical protein
MDKKIMSICFLLIIVIAVTVTYIAFNQSFSLENQQNNIPVGDDVTDEDISDEIDDFFIYEGDEIEIGDMV